MYKSKKKPKTESPALKFIREKREEQWEQILRSVKNLESKEHKVA